MIDIQTPYDFGNYLSIKYRQYSIASNIRSSGFSVRLEIPSGYKSSDGRNVKLKFVVDVSIGESSLGDVDIAFQVYDHTGQFDKSLYMYDNEKAQLNYFLKKTIDKLPSSFVPVVSPDTGGYRWVKASSSLNNVKALKKVIDQFMRDIRTINSLMKGGRRI